MVGWFIAGYGLVWIFRVTELARLEHLALSPGLLPYSELFWQFMCVGIPLLGMYLLAPYYELSPLYAWRLPRWTKWFWRYFLLTILYLFIMNMTLFKAGQSHWQLPHISVMMWIKVMMTVVFEESAFRGIVYHGLRARFSESIGLVGSSLLFGLWHVPGLVLQGYSGLTITGQCLNICLFALLLSSMTRYSKSIFPAMLCHFIYNFSFLL